MEQIVATRENEGVEKKRKDFLERIKNSTSKLSSTLRSEMASLMRKKIKNEEDPEVKENKWTECLRDEDIAQLWEGSCNIDQLKHMKCCPICFSNWKSGQYIRNIKKRMEKEKKRNRRNRRKN